MEEEGRVSGDQAGVEKLGISGGAVLERLRHDRMRLRQNKDPCGVSGWFYLKQSRIDAKQLSRGRKRVGERSRRDRKSSLELKPASVRLYLQRAWFLYSKYN